MFFLSLLFAGVLKNNIVLQTMFDKLYLPTRIRAAPNGQVFITQKAGRILVYPNIDTPTPTLVADLKNHVFSFQDHALSGIAIDNQYPAKPYIYVIYSADADYGDYRGVPKYQSNCGNGVRCLNYRRIARLTLANNVMTKFDVIWESGCSVSYSHVNGGLEMLSNGGLAATVGDLAFYEMMDYGQADFCPPTDPNDPNNQFKKGGFRSQYDGTPGGKLLYVPPSQLQASLDASLLTTADRQARMMINPVHIGKGLRNPWSLTYNKELELLIVSVVGWNTYEWINIFPSPLNPTYDANKIGNSGWPCYEGGWQNNDYTNFNKANNYVCNNLIDFQRPDLVTRHAQQFGDTQLRNQGQSSITGALVYSPANKYPAQWNNALFYCDFAWGYMWMVPNNLYGQQYSNTAKNSAIALVDAPGMIDLVQIDGFIYITNINENAIYRLVSTEFPLPPIVNLKCTVDHGPLPLQINCDANARDVMGNPIQYEWDFGLGYTVGQATFSKLFTLKQVMTLKLRVKAGALTTIKSTTIAPGYFTTNTIKVLLNDQPATPQSTWKVGDKIDYSVETKDELGQLVTTTQIVSQLFHCYPPVCSLRNNLQSNDCHIHTINTWTLKGTTTMPDHEFPSRAQLVATSTHPISLLSDVTKLEVYPEKIPLLLQTSPSDIELLGLASPLCTTSTIPGLYCIHYYIQNGAVAVTAPLRTTLPSTVSSTANNVRTIQVYQFSKWVSNSTALQSQLGNQLSSNQLDFMLTMPNIELTAYYTSTLWTFTNAASTIQKYAQLPQLHTISFTWIGQSDYYLIEYTSPSNNVPKYVITTLNSYTFTNLDYCEQLTALVYGVTGNQLSLPTAPLTSKAYCTGPNLCPTSQCIPYSITIHDFSTGNVNNLNRYWESKCGGQQQNNQLLVNPVPNCYWYTLLYDQYCYDASTMTHLEFTITANSRFSVRLDLRSNDCADNGPGSVNLPIANYLVSPTLVRIPLASFNVNLSKLKAIAFDQYTSPQVGFGNIKFIRMCDCATPATSFLAVDTVNKISGLSDTINAQLQVTNTIKVTPTQIGGYWYTLLNIEQPVLKCFDASIYTHLQILVRNGDGSIYLDTRDMACQEGFGSSLQLKLSDYAVGNQLVRIPLRDFKVPLKTLKALVIVPLNNNGIEFDTITLVKMDCQLPCTMTIVGQSSQLLGTNSLQLPITHTMLMATQVLNKLMMVPLSTTSQYNIWVFEEPQEVSPVMVSAQFIKEPLIVRVFKPPVP